MIDKQLLSRIKRIHEAYDYHHGLQDTVALINTSPQTQNHAPQKAKSWQELLKEDSGDGSGGGGGSTAKGLRGKNAVNAVQAAKAEMKRLGRR